MTTVHEAEGIRVYRNPRAAGRGEPYGRARGEILNEAGFSAAEREITRWPGYAPTPLQSLPAMATRLGLASLLYKDERGRFGLKSFKALGGAYAVYRLLKQRIESSTGGGPVTSADVLSGAWRDLVAQTTVTCATDGNHGRSVAWGAQLFGCRCIIFIHETVSEGRRAAIARYGAEVIRVPGNYDDAVRHAAAQAAEHGWIVVSDTSYEGYREIPIDVMHGYGVMAHEIVRQVSGDVATHVFVQAGVGALAAAICATFWIEWGERRPFLVVVEPTKADCFFQSGLAGKPVAVHGDLDTLMAGLACGEVSPLAWEIVSAGADAFVEIDDRHALEAVRAFARPESGDPAIVSGETGAAGLAALLAARPHPDLWRVLQLDRASRVLLLGSEGDTDPEIYRQIVGRPAEEVAKV